jgi:hypothetical protein
MPAPPAHPHANPSNPNRDFPQARDPQALPPPPRLKPPYPLPYQSKNYIYKPPLAQPISLQPTVINTRYSNTTYPLLSNHDNESKSPICFIKHHLHQPFGDPCNHYHRYTFRSSQNPRSVRKRSPSWLYQRYKNLHV